MSAHSAGKNLTQTMEIASTAATSVLPDIQLPPGVPSLNDVDWPAHTVVPPAMSAGRAFTTTDANDLHVVGSV